MSEAREAAFPAVLERRYACEGVLGRGATGIVFGARDREHGQPVAIKVLAPEASLELDQARFEREARVLAELEHPGVVRLLETGIHGSTKYFVTERLEGPTLAGRLAAGPLPVRQVVEVLDGVLAALEHVHGAGLVHRDIKPSNIVLTPRGPVVIDFGLSREQSTELTLPGVVVGTPEYMSPELVVGEPPTAAADLFAAALTGLEALTRVDVHGAEESGAGSSARIASSLASGAYLAAAATALEPHGALGRVLLRALARRPEDRFASALGLRQALAALAAPGDPAQEAAGTLTILPERRSARTDGEPASRGAGPGLPERYRVIRELGRGGCGIVYEAEDTELGRGVAVKMLHPRTHADTELLGRFRREARITAALVHPHVVRIYDHGIQTGEPWIVYELLPGPNLAELLEDTRPEWREALGIASQVLQALQAAHDQGVLHRDVKPHNVLQSEPGIFKLTDFGIARWVSGHTALTEPGALLGSVPYMEPDAIRGVEGTPQTDVYATGVMLYELLTGVRPFRGGIREILRGHADQQVVLPSEVHPGLPRELDELVLRSLAKDRAGRYASAREFHQAIAERLDGPRRDVSRSGSRGAAGRPASRGAVAVTPRPPGDGAKVPRGPVLALALSLGALLAWTQLPGTTRPPVQATPAPISAAETARSRGAAVIAARDRTRAQLDEIWQSLWALSPDGRRLPALVTDQVQVHRTALADLEALLGPLAARAAQSAESLGDELGPATWLAAEVCATRMRLTSLRHVEATLHPQARPPRAAENDPTAVIGPVATIFHGLADCAALEQFLTLAALLLERAARSAGGAPFALESLGLLRAIGAEIRKLSWDEAARGRARMVEARFARALESLPPPHGALLGRAASGVFRVAREGATARGRAQVGAVAADLDAVGRALGGKGALADLVRDLHDTVQSSPSPTTASPAR